MFFMVLDLRLTRLGLSGAPFFISIREQLYFHLIKNHVCTQEYTRMTTSKNAQYPPKTISHIHKHFQCEQNYITNR